MGAVERDTLVVVAWLMKRSIFHLPLALLLMVPNL